MTRNNIYYVTQPTFLSNAQNCSVVRDNTGTRSGRARWGVVPVIARYLVRTPVSARVMRLSNFSDFLIALAKLVLRLGCVATSCNLRLLGGWPKTPRWAKTLPFDGKVSHGPNSWNYVRNTIKNGLNDLSCLRGQERKQLTSPVWEVQAPTHCCTIPGPVIGSGG